MIAFIKIGLSSEKKHGSFIWYVQARYFLSELGSVAHAVSFAVRVLCINLAN
jgi:hypothetical protein